MLNHEDIKANNLIQNADNNNFKNASYDLRVDKIITIEGQEKNSFKIQPNSMVIAISKERLNLPVDIMGHAYVRTRLSQIGIMANNIGIIDPEYQGQLSSVLVNFGKNEYEIKEGDTFLRITLTKIKAPTTLIPLGYGPFSNDTYLNMRKSDSMSYLGNSFINMDNVIKKVTDDSKKEINQSLAKTTQISGIWLAGVGLIFAAIALFIGFRGDSINDKTIQRVENFENQINTFNKNQVILLNIQKKLEDNIISLEHEVDSVTLKNTELNKEIEKYKKILKSNAPNKGK